MEDLKITAMDSLKDAYIQYVLQAVDTESTYEWTLRYDPDTLAFRITHFKLLDVDQYILLDILELADNLKDSVWLDSYLSNSNIPATFICDECGLVRIFVLAISTEEKQLVESIIDTEYCYIPRIKVEYAEHTGGDSDRII